MDMNLQDQVAFRMTGQAGAGLDALPPDALRPALLAPYRDLTALRYDFPLVLVKDGPEESCLRSLSAVIDGLLQEVAPEGPEGERLRQQVLRLEREIRAHTARGVAGSLTALWEKAARRLIALADDAVGHSLERARAALAVDGKLIDCNAATAKRVFTHAWQRVQQKKAEAALDQIERLSVRLSDILTANRIGSETGRNAESLKAAVGTNHAGAFDFDVMSRLLARVSAASALPASRLRRIQWALGVLKSQRFFRRGEAAGEPYVFSFENCAAARDAFCERLPAMTELIKAIAVGRLEVEGRYIEARHDALFAAYDGRALDAEELSFFPDYLVCLRWKAGDAADETALWDLLSAGIPAKVVVQSDDILLGAAQGTLPALAARNGQLAAMAMGLRHAYVLQSVSAHLLKATAAILKGLRYPGPALFSVYSGCSASPGDIPPYLNAAAAMQSRAFPAFCYDPSAPDWASAFSLAQNPDVEQDWTTHDFAYEDAAHQRVTEKTAFTFADFVACDARYAGHFAPISQARWGAHLAPVTDCPSGGMYRGDTRVPYVLLVDHDNRLHRAIVDDKLVRATERCRAVWHSLQELGGIRNSHAQQLVGRERKKWEEEKQQELKTAGAQAQPATPTPSAPPRQAIAAAVPSPSPVQAAPAPAESVPAPAEEKSGDEPYIETPRCTSCDECTQISGAIFAYDANKQAYITNPDAGTYRELVEAAESCQVSIIHPGKPRNPNEPGLAELVERAQPFL